MKHNVRQCSKCLKDTAYRCASCPCDHCLLCKETHVQDLKTIDHDVTLYSKTFNYIPKQEFCLKPYLKLNPFPHDISYDL